MVYILHGSGDVEQEVDAFSEENASYFSMRREEQNFMRIGSRCSSVNTAGSSATDFVNEQLERPACPMKIRMQIDIAIDDYVY